MTHIALLVTLVFASLFLVESRVKRHSDASLEMVHVIFRHGDRTPDKDVIYKNDPYVNETYYPIGHGQLTNAGKRKEYQIGKALRRRYSTFLANFTLDTVDSRCTDYNRTKMSLQLVLASLFPPKGDHVWEKKLNWQPVPFNYWPLKEDHVLGDPMKNCPVYKEAFFHHLNSKEGKAMYEKYEKLRRYLEHHAGETLHSKKFASLYFTLTTEHENGLKMPEWAEPVYPLIKHLAIMDYNVSTATPQLKRLASGFLARKIIGDTKAKIRGEKYSRTKVFLYSAHESNVAHFLRFLGVFHSHVPPYGSYISVEVHNYNGERGFKVYYQDYSTEKPRKVRLPRCGSFCKLDDFERFYGHLMPQSEKECF
ncbi:venom acid phosphatase Acph-1 [Anoplophora glabripennis]|nr:venom acid phosphatase Acph-1 [Anoplophora glabripennis]